MSEYCRGFELERASVDAEAGTFKGVLFTDGEAEDGHILNIAGGEIPERMPFFVNHQADPRDQLGSLFLTERTQHQIRVRGEIMLDGDGAALEVRRDVLAKMAAGHVRALSGRWDAEPEHVTRRLDLAKGHVAAVSEKSPVRKRYGLYFEKWRALEGSLVGLGADKQATLRFARDPSLPEPVRAFWRSLGEVSAEPQVVQPTPESLLAAFGAQVRDMQRQGIALDDLANVISEIRTPPPSAREAELMAQIQSLEARIAGLDPRVMGDPGAPVDPAAMLRAIQDTCKEERAEALARIRAALDAMRRG